MNMTNVTLWVGLWLMIVAAWCIPALIFLGAWDWARGDWRRFCRQILEEDSLAMMVMAISVAVLVTVVGPMIMDLTIRGL